MTLTTRTKDAAPAEPVESVVLELTKYSRYVRGDTLYEKGQGYKFTRAQADELLTHVDEISGIPVWKRWVPAAKKVVVQREVGPVDMTKETIAPAPVAEKKQINIGDDSELAGLLPDDDESIEV